MRGLHGRIAGFREASNDALMQVSEVWEIHGMT